MIKKTIDSVVYYIIFVFCFGITPLLIQSFPDLLGYYDGVLDLWLLNPIFSFFISALICRKNADIFILPIIVGIADLTILFYFYNDSVFLFLILYVLLSLAGCFWGQKLNEEKRRIEY